MSWCKSALDWRDLKNVILRTFVYDFQFVCSHRRVRVPWPCWSVSVQGRRWSRIRFRICTRSELCGVEKLPTELHSRQAPILLHLTHHYGHPELTVKDAHTVRGLSGGEREWFVSKRHSYRYIHTYCLIFPSGLPSPVLEQDMRSGFSKKLHKFSRCKISVLQATWFV